MKNKEWRSDAPDVQTEPEPEWAVVESWPPSIKDAEVGDRGRVIGAISHESNGLLRLVLSVAPEEMVLLPGGFHRIQEILDTFLHQTLEVVPGAGSSYGFHDVRLVRDEEGTAQNEKGHPTGDRGVS